MASCIDAVGIDSAAGGRGLGSRSEIRDFNPCRRGGCGPGAAAWLVFRPYSASAWASLVGRFYTAELLRLVLAAGVFLFAVRWIDSLSIAAMLGAYLLIHLLTGALMSLVSNLPTR